VRRAEVLGLIERRVSAADARVYQLRLTAEAKRRLGAAVADLRDERRALQRELGAAFRGRRGER
jgi:DNA-binding MarR family transcriptional regulator